MTGTVVGSLPLAKWCVFGALVCIAWALGCLLVACGRREQDVLDEWWRQGGRDR